MADQAVIGNVAGALTNLRWALNVGVPAVVIADALADGVRTVARVIGAGPGDPFRLAPALGMPPWKVKRARPSHGAGPNRACAGAGGGRPAQRRRQGQRRRPGVRVESAVRRLATARELR